MADLPGLKPLSLPKEHQLIKGNLEGEDLVITNEIFSCQGMRKLHLEIAQFGKTLQILHCVFFPQPTFDLPIFGLDVVVGPLGVSAAIVDLSPVSSELPESFKTSLKKILVPDFQQPREIPSWGYIFSPYVQFIRPLNTQEELSFYEVVDSYLNTLYSFLIVATPQKRNNRSTIQRYKGQISYCRQQKLNDKTRRLLETAFDQLWADWYIKEILFDEPHCL